MSSVQFLHYACNQKQPQKKETIILWLIFLTAGTVDFFLIKPNYLPVAEKIKAGFEWKEAEDEKSSCGGSQNANYSWC